MITTTQATPASFWWDGNLTDGTNTLIFENSTVIHPKDRLIIAIGPETQKDPTKPLQIKSAQSPAAFRLIPAKKY